MTPGGRPVVLRHGPGLALVVLVGLLSLGPRIGHAESADSACVRFEIGGSTDFTNEQYYELTEEERRDSLIFGRVLVGSPESRFAGIMNATIDGARGLGATAYRLRTDLSLGNALQRGALASNWRSDFAPDWRFSIGEDAEYRHDCVFRPIVNTHFGSS